MKEKFQVESTPYKWAINVSEIDTDFGSNVPEKPVKKFEVGRTYYSADHSRVFIVKKITEKMVFYREYPWGEKIYRAKRKNYDYSNGDFWGISETFRAKTNDTSIERHIIDARYEWNF